MPFLVAQSLHIFFGYSRSFMAISIKDTLPLLSNLSFCVTNNIARVIAWSIFTLISIWDGHEKTPVNNYQTDNVYAYIEANYENQVSCVMQYTLSTYNNG